MAKKLSKNCCNFTPLLSVALIVIIIGAFFVGYYYQNQSRIGVGTTKNMEKYVITKMYNIIEEKDAMMARANSMFKVESSDTFGNYLVDQKGMTLYSSKNDNGDSKCYDECANTWKAVWTQGTVAFGEGADGELGITERTDGPWQITYDGKPLYYYANDRKAGDTNGSGVSNLWSLVKP